MSADLASFVLAQVFAPWAAELLADTTAASIQTKAMAWRRLRRRWATAKRATGHRSMRPCSSTTRCALSIEFHWAHHAVLALLQGGWLVLLAPGAPSPSYTNASLLKARRCESPHPPRVTIEAAGGAERARGAGDAELAEWLAAIAGAHGDGDGGDGGIAAQGGGTPTAADGTADKGPAAAGSRNWRRAASGAYFGAQRVGW